MTAGHVERVLRGGRSRDAALAVLWGGAVYGAVMGTLGGLTADRWPQVVFAAAKVPLLLAVTAALALPAFVVLNTVAGLRADLPDALRAAAVTQGAVGVVLASLAPFTAVWYLTSGDYTEGIVFNGLMFAVASLTAQAVLRRRYAALVARNRRHRHLMRVWLVLYAFVGVQLGWTLRPFVGEPGVRPTFLRAGGWGTNAYVVVAEPLWRVVGR